MFVARLTAGWTISALCVLVCCRGRLFPPKPRLRRGPPISRGHVQDRPGDATPRVLSQRGLGRGHGDGRHHVAGARGQIMGPQQHQVRPQLVPLQQGQLQPDSHRHWAREHRKRYGTFRFYWSLFMASCFGIFFPIGISFSCQYAIPLCYRFSLFLYTDAEQMKCCIIDNKEGTVVVRGAFQDYMMILLV